MFYFDLINPLYAAVFTASFSTFIAGTALTWSSPVIPKLNSNSEFPVTSTETAWISSLVMLGAAMGSILFGYSANRFGRRYTILVLGAPFLVSYLLMAVSSTLEAFYVGRLGVGLGVGGCFAVVPMYIAELASRSNRGALVSTVSCAVSMGFLFSYALGPFVSVRVFNFVLSVFPAVFIVSFVFFGYETAHFYVLTGQQKLARDVLVQIRGVDHQIDQELSEICKKFQPVSEDDPSDSSRTRSAVKAFAIAIGLLLFQQFSGINSILLYSQTIFEMAGSSIDPRICSIVLGSVQVISSFTTPFLVDRFGRKFLLIASAVGMIAGQVPLGVYCYLRDLGRDMTSFDFLPVLALTFTIFSYNSGCGPIPWTILSEIFPSKVKAVGTSTVTFINWMTAFLITKYFEDMSELVGLGASFWIFSGCCAVAIAFVKFYVIETKGKSLEEIQDELGKV